MITFEVKGNWSKTEKFFKRVQQQDVRPILERYAMAGVRALEIYTPKRSGKTAMAWSYEIEETDTGITIWFHNSNINGHVNIAMLIQYGHGTNGGGFVQGVDYINPALSKVFKELVRNLWLEVTSDG
ncbi:MAG: HK97 gp10 family phage protein [Mogibacterium sp.]|nr:HK97 gp10 family phage protein [Mogibacterium sp.]